MKALGAVAANEPTMQLLAAQLEYEHTLEAHGRALASIHRVVEWFALKKWLTANKPAWIAAHGFWLTSDTVVGYRALSDHQRLERDRALENLKRTEEGFYKAKTIYEAFVGPLDDPYEHPRPEAVKEVLKPVTQEADPEVWTSGGPKGMFSGFSGKQEQFAF